MKNLKTIALVMLTLLFSNTVINAQEASDQDTETVTGVFDGFDGEHFTFNYINEDDDEGLMLFVKISPEVLEQHNLNDEGFIGKSFNITFTSETVTEMDEDGDEQEYIVRTIINLELLD